VAALSHALDVTEGQPMGHAERSCLIGLRLADATGLEPERRSSLFYALLAALEAWLPGRDASFADAA
ncbi:MAG: hypothetical protein ACXVFM_17615, partial [Solirubrobacteraceae bacterium]